MRIGIVGTGYVGLVSGACLADFGHEVVCVDQDHFKIEALRLGIMPIFEPGLAELVNANVNQARLTFTTDLADIATARAIFVAVGTPSRRGDGHADLSHVFAAARDIAAAMQAAGRIDPLVLVTKSTVPVGTGDEIARLLAEIVPEMPITIASNPEFLREGAAIGDFKRPDRIVVGADDELARTVLSEVYAPLSLNQASPMVMTSRRSAELIKYASNAFLATKISFINEMADLCEAVGANVQDVARGMGFDNRIGRTFLHAGPGYGGSCFPKDTLALLKTAADFEAPLRIVEAVVSVNEARKRSMGRKVIRAMGGHVRGRRVGVLGLTFKPNTDDMRDSPAIAIIQTLQDAGAIVSACDPEGVEQARAYLSDVDFVADPYAAALGADAIVLVTEWDAYRALDLGRIAGAMAGPTFVDLRNAYTRETVTRAGLRYTGVGRPGPVADDVAVPSPCALPVLETADAPIGGAG